MGGGRRERRNIQKISPQSGFLQYPTGPSSPQYLVVGSSGGTTFYTVQFQVFTGCRCHSHDLRWHLPKHLLPFPQFSMMVIFVWILTKTLPLLGLEIAFSCWAVCTYLKFHCDGLSYGGNVLRHVTSFYNSFSQVFPDLTCRIMNLKCIPWISIDIDTLSWCAGSCLSECNELSRLGTWNCREGKYFEIFELGENSTSWN